MNAPITLMVSVKALLAAATELLIEVQDRLDGDADFENDDPGGCEHDGREYDAGI